ncbi:hypothetical protein NDU88_004293 [Pleurodeles waltl]|uniref:Uncharacterized protein n=1 Tax=Pleurodeles waltl TaxID=8319 RepID=A0AAV7QF08_PLEWA|nr:hypothetical protein NDU88_004293 [Pleurodeles waltl]
MYAQRHWGRVRETLSPDTCRAVPPGLFGAVGTRLTKGSPLPGSTRVPAQRSSGRCGSSAGPKLGQRHSRTPLDMSVRWASGSQDAGDGGRRWFPPVMSGRTGVGSSQPWVQGWRHHLDRSAHFIAKLSWRAACQRADYSKDSEPA